MSLGEPHDLSWRSGKDKHVVLSGFESQIIHSAAQSLYRLVNQASWSREDSVK